MNPIAESFEELFARENWTYQKRDDRTYSFGFRGDNNRYDFWVFLNEKGNIITMYAVIPMSAPEPKRLVMGDFLHRANYDMMLGNFEIDMRDGEIRFKCSADFDNAKPDPDMLNRMIDCCLSMADRYMPGIGSVLYADMEPAAAIQQCEGDRRAREERSTIVQ